MSDFIHLITKINKLSAICSFCGKKADYSYCKIEKKDQILVGASNAYEARCLDCWRNGNPTKGV